MLVLIACSPPPPLDPPHVGGLRPGMTLAQGIELLPPARATASGEITVQDANLTSEVGSITRMQARRLNYGRSTLKSGASRREAEQMLGASPSSFDRDGDQVLVYEFKEFRYDLIFDDDRLTSIELSIRPRPAPRGSADYGRGTRGDHLPQRLQLAVDGVSLGMSPEEVEKLQGTPDSRLSGATLAYADLATMVDYQDGRARRVLGRKLLRDGADWVSSGMTAAEVQKRMAQVGRLRSQSASVVSYTFLQHGQVRMLVLPDQTIGALELLAP